jgi:peptide/nickel transport system substrate-binding protein
MRRPHLSLTLVAGLATTVLLTGAGPVSYFEESLPTTMNPMFAQSMVDFRSQELVFDRLYYHSAVNNELVSRLVDRYEKVDGGKSVKLYLKSGVKWHDGQSFSAKDVCFTVNAMLDPRTSSPIAKNFIESLEACDSQDKGRTALITYRKVYHNPLDRLGFAILPEHKFDSTAIKPDSEFSNRPVGTGPMTASRGTRGVSFKAYANEHHGAKIADLKLQEGSDPFVQVRTIINAGVHGVISVAPQYRPEIESQDDVALKAYDLRSWWFVAINTAKPYLAPKQIRQALDVTLDRTELREKSIGVSPNDPHPPCEFISGPFVQSSPYYNRAIKVKERSDAAKVKSLMAAGGAAESGGRWTFNGSPIKLKVGMNAPLEMEARDLINQIGNQLEAGGFGREVYRVPSDEWNRKVVTAQMQDFDLLIGKWSFGTVEEVGPLFHTRARGQGSLNIFNYSDAKVDELLAQYDIAKTDTEAQDAYHALHEYLSIDLPYLFLWKLDTKSAWRNEIRSNMISPYFYFSEFDQWKAN